MSRRSSLSAATAAHQRSRTEFDFAKQHDTTQSEQNQKKTKANNPTKKNVDKDDDATSLESLAKLESEWRAKTLQVQMARSKLRRKGQHEQVRERERLQAELEHVQKVIDENHHSRLALRDIVMKKQLDLSDLKTREESQSKQLRLFQKQKQLDALCYVELEVEQLREYKHTMRRMMLKSSAQLDSVRDELKEREKKDVNDLSYLLSRADTLTAYIEEEKRAENDKRADVALLLKQGVDGAEGAVRLVDHVVAERQRKMEKDRIDRENLIRELNHERSLLREKEQVLVDKRTEHEQMQSRGIDVQEAFELGDAPPLELVKMNFSAKTNAARKQRLADELSDCIGDSSLALESLWNEVKASEENIEAQKAAFESEIQQLRALEPLEDYDGGLGAPSYAPEQREIYLLMRSLLLDDLLPPILEMIEQTHLSPRQLDANEEMFIRARDKLRAEANTRERNLAAFCVWQQLLWDSVDEMLVEVAKLVLDLRGGMKQRASAAILTALKNEAPEDGARCLEELQRQRCWRPSRFVHGNVTRTRQELEERRRQLLPTPEVDDGKNSFFGFRRRSTKQKQEERRTRINDETAATDAAERRDVDCDSGIVELSFLDAEHVPSELLADLESRYWKQMTTSIIQLDGKCVDGFTSARGDVSGWHLAAIAVDGSIEVWKISEHTHHILLRQHEKSKQRFKSLSIASERCRTLATMDEQNVVQVWDTSSPLLDVAEKKKKKLKKGAEFVFEALKPRLLVQLSEADLARASWRSAREKHRLQPLSMQPTTLCFHPAQRFDLSSTSLMLGTASGLIIRWNFAACDASTRLITNGNTIASREPPLPKASRFSTPTPYIKREYFQGHTSPPILVGFLAGGPDVVSVDVHAYVNIWRYTSDSFCAFDWITPTVRYRIDLDEIKFSPSSDETEVELFPPVAVDDDAAAEMFEFSANEYYQTVMESMRDHMNPRPHSTDVLPNGAKTTVFRPMFNRLSAVDRDERAEDRSTMHAFRHDSRGVLIQHVAVKYDCFRRKGRLLQAQMTPNGRGIVMLVFYEKSEGTSFAVSRLCFRLASVNLDGLKLRDICIECELANPNNRSPGSLPLWRCGPVLDPPGSDYLYVYTRLSRSLKVYSLSSGQQVRTISAIDGLLSRFSETELQVTKFAGPRDTSLNASDMFTFGRHPFRIGLVHNNSSRIFIWTITDANSVEMRRQFLHPAVRKQSIRLQQTPAENRVHSTRWGFGYDGSGRLNLHFHVRDTFRRLVVELADKVADGEVWFAPEAPVQLEKRPWPEPAADTEGVGAPESRLGKDEEASGSVPLESEASIDDQNDSKE